MTVADLVYIDDTGYHFADYPTFLQFVTQAYQNIYGSDIVLTPDSQDGQWVAIQAQMLYDTAAIGASAFNSFSPVTAQGVGLSRVVKINGLRREIPSNSTAVLTIVGQAGAVITNGVAQDTLGQNWNLPFTVTIPGGGTIDVTATAQIEGAINAAVNTINIIFTPTLGWQTVNNSAAATVGSPVEEDGALRARQIQSTANPSKTVLEGTYGAIANVTGVTDVAVWENDTDAVDGNNQPAHSIFAVVKGGSVTDVAQAIQVHKTPGTYPWSGPFYTFAVSGVSATIGATYTNNAITFTVVATVSSSSTIIMRGIGKPSASGTLTKASGSGDATIAFTSYSNVGGGSEQQVVYDSKGMPITIGFFQPPLAAVIGVQVSLTAGAAWTTDFETIIATQIAAYINALGIGAGQQIGGEVQIPPLYGLAYVPGYAPNMYTLTGIQIQINAGGFGSSPLGIDFIHLPSCSTTPGTDVIFVVS